MITRARAQMRSNIVACKLQLNDAASALEDARLCVEACPTWPKGTLRLAECQSALGLSNECCNTCQRALTLDPGNEVALRLLRKELRNRNRQSSSSSASTSTSAASTSSRDDATSQSPSPPPSASASAPPSSNRSSQGSNNSAPAGGGSSASADIDDNPLSYGMSDFFSDVRERFDVLWRNAPATTRFLLVTGAIAVALAIVSGVTSLLGQRDAARIGAGDGSYDKYRNGGDTMGNYGGDSAYARYGGKSGGSRRSSNLGYGEGGGGSANSYSSHYSSRYTASRHRSSNLFWDGSRGYFGAPSYLGMMAIGGAAYYVFGVSPWQVISVINFLSGRGGFVHIGGGGFGGGFGRGMGFGGRRGFGRRRGHWW